MSRYFFDTSALVKHFHAEAGTETVDQALKTSQELAERDMRQAGYYK